MRTIVDIEGTNWIREDLPGFHVRYHVDDLRMSLSNDEGAGQVTAAGAAIAAQQGGYVSEIERMNFLFPRTDAQSRLVNGKTNEVITLPENTDPVPVAFSTLQAAQQWFQDHPYYHHQLVVDGNPYSTGWADSPARFTTRTGLITFESASSVPSPLPVTVLPTPSDADQDVTVSGEFRQKLIRTDGFGSGVLRVHLVAPSIVNPTSPGFVRIAEKPGSEPHNGSLKIIMPDGLQLLAVTGIDPSISWSTSSAAGTPYADCIIPPGTPFNIEYRHLEPPSTTAPNDVLVDIRMPA